jgi:LacI family transcriptional regulator
MLYTAALGISMEDLAATVDSSLAGLVLVMPPDSPAIYNRLDKLNVPYVSVLRDRSNDWVVNCDDTNGGYLAGQHLVGLGHRQIAHLRGANDVSTTSGREFGFLRALKESGVEPRKEHMVTAGFDWRSGMHAMEKLLSLPERQRPTAVFCANDLCAEGAIRAIRAKGLTVPDDIAVVGFDDTWFATMVRPALTTVRMPIKEMGQTAARMLMDRIEGELVEDTRPVLPVSLTIRYSCGLVSAMSHDETSAFRSHIQ